MRGMRWWMLVAVAGCGPQVGVGDDNGDETTSGSTGPASSTVATTMPSPTTEPGTATGVPPNPTSATTSDETTSTSDADSSTTEFECGCPPGVPIELDDELLRGFTPAEAVAELADVEQPFHWYYNGAPDTTLRVQVSYVGGQILQQPGGDDGCLFINSPCDDGVEMEVEATISTADGWVMLTGPAVLSGVVGDELELAFEAQPIAANAGTLAMQPLVLDDEPATVADIGVFVEVQAGGRDDAEIRGTIAETGDPATLGIGAP